jgi:DMSO/TMAO reductase YedYZ molybdopterin-dependent catalytic subunit
MAAREVSRRTVLQGGAALAALGVFRSRMTASAFASQRGAGLGHWSAQSAPAAATFPTRPGEEVVPWLDQPPTDPVPDVAGNLLQWEALDSWITPNDKFFTVQHYSKLVVEPQTWQMEISGLVGQPLTFTLDDLKARPSVDVPFTLECSGNHGFPWFIGGIGNAVWTGTPLAPLLEAAGVLPAGIEVVFWGADTGTEVVRDVTFTEQFARSMSLAQAMDPNLILCYAMNGEPLPSIHGGPVRLIAPGWFGVANVKWLERIELLDKRYEGRFMGRDYVTMRAAQHAGATVVHFTSVGHALLKSEPARVTRLGDDYRIVGAAWGGEIAGVEVQIDGGAWQAATLEEIDSSGHTWTFWSLDWGQPDEGEHTVTSRAIDSAGHVQPAMDDPVIANKMTYWESNGQITRHVQIGEHTFPETGRTLTGAFLAFWEQHGGLAIFGYPLTEEFDETSLVDGQTYRVQYFERQRFELHPENAEPYQVLLGLLGIETLPGTQAYPRADPDTSAGSQYFDATGHNVRDRFLDYWQQNGGLMISGYPLTEALNVDGVTTQYFERARFELHPDYQPPYDVLLGLLGSEVLTARYGGQLPPGAA